MFQVGETRRFLLTSPVSQAKAEAICLSMATAPPAAGSTELKSAQIATDGISDAEFDDYIKVIADRKLQNSPSP